jgi:urease subunit gamma/beta
MLVALSARMVKNRIMELTPSEQDHLLIFVAAELARSRRNRGLLLNVPEAIALISHAVIESARDGKSHSQALEDGKSAIREDELLPGVGPLLSGLAVEAEFSDWRRLVVINFESKDTNIPGAVVRLSNIGAEPESDSVTISVINNSDIQISITSHMHFFEVNPRLAFDRESAYGRRLNIGSGMHIDFPPGQSVEVHLIPISGDRVLIGFAGLVDGALDEPGMKERAMKRASELGYLNGGK